MNSPAARAAQNCLTAAAARTARDVTRPGEMVYLIEGAAQVRERLFTELTTSGVAVQSFECPGEYLCLARQDSAACVIFDTQLLDVTGIDLLRQLTGEGAPPVILMSAHPDFQFGVRAIKAGAIDFLVHPVKSDALLCSVNEALSRDRIARQRRAGIAMLQECYSKLTPREREVLALLVRGRLNKQVAGTFAIREGTVKAHRAQITRKMGARSFADLVCMAIKLQILEEDRSYTEPSFTSVLRHFPTALA
jgi:FixJ family two-component response regulator